MGTKTRDDIGIPETLLGKISTKTVHFLPNMWSLSNIHPLHIVDDSRYTNIKNKNKNIFICLLFKQYFFGASTALDYDIG
jgi:hypothetical protein